MTGTFDFKKAFVGIMERTGNPMAPIHLQEAYRYANAIGKLMAKDTNLEEVTVYRDLFLSAWDEEGQLEEVCGKPRFIMALAGIFAEALVQYAIETTKGVRDVP